MKRRFEQLKQLLNEQILVLDGAMGTMIQSHKLEEKDYRGEQFKNHSCDLKGNNDLLSITRNQKLLNQFTALILNLVQIS